MKMGRPEIPLDWERFEKLSQLPIRAEDIAWVLGVSVDTISRRLRERCDCTFAEWLDQNRAHLRANLMAKQVTVALAGNPTMLIWTGKQYLGQSDKIAATVQPGDGTQLDRLPAMTKEQARKLLDERLRPKGEQDVAKELSGASTGEAGTGVVETTGVAVKS